MHPCHSHKNGAVGSGFGTGTEGSVGVVITSVGAAGGGVGTDWGTGGVATRTRFWIGTCWCCCC